MIWKLILLMGLISLLNINKRKMRTKINSCFLWWLLMKKIYLEKVSSKVNKNWKNQRGWNFNSSVDSISIILVQIVQNIILVNSHQNKLYQILNWWKNSLMSLTISSNFLNKNNLHFSQLNSNNVHVWDCVK